MGATEAMDQTPVTVQAAKGAETGPPAMGEPIPFMGWSFRLEVAAVAAAAARAEAKEAKAVVAAVLEVVVKAVVASETDLDPETTITTLDMQVGIATALRFATGDTGDMAGMVAMAGPVAPEAVVREPYRSPR